MTRFTVSGPHVLRPTKDVGGKAIDKACIKAFWEKHAAYQEARGCYLFGVRAGRGIIPWYVGQATKSFQAEIFQPDKLVKYGATLVKTKSGTPVVFLISSPVKKGPLNKKHIEQLETFLIREAKFSNDRLLNKQKIPRQDWAIVGAYRSGKGKPGSAAKSLKKALKWD